MHGVAAEIAQEVTVLFQDNNLNPGAGEQKCVNQTGGPAGQRHTLGSAEVASLVVRGAVSALQIRFPTPPFIRACGFPARGFPMIFLTWLRSCRVVDGAAQAVQAVIVKQLRPNISRLLVRHLLTSVNESVSRPAPVPRSLEAATQLDVGTGGGMKSRTTLTCISRFALQQLTSRWAGSVGPQHPAGRSSSHVLWPPEPAAEQRRDGRCHERTHDQGVEQ